MRSYRVEWAIDVDADTPEDAARQAWAHMRREDSTANVFDVIESGGNGDAVRVDLQELAESREGAEVTSAQYEHGFDVTDFGGNWPAFRNESGLRFVSQNDRGFHWRTQGGVSFTTGNNPDTGQYIRPEYRDPQPGFASYIGLTGPRPQAVEMVALVRKHAVYIKDSSPGTRSFI